IIAFLRATKLTESFPEQFLLLESFSMRLGFFHYPSTAMMISSVFMATYLVSGSLAGVISRAMSWKMCLFSYMAGCFIHLLQLLVFGMGLDGPTALSNGVTGAALGYCLYRNREAARAISGPDQPRD